MDREVSSLMKKVAMLEDKHEEMRRKCAAADADRKAAMARTWTALLVFSTRISALAVSTGYWWGQHSASRPRASQHQH